MASRSKTRKCKNSMYTNGFMKADGKIRRIGIFHKRHRAQVKRATAKEYAELATYG